MNRLKKEITKKVSDDYPKTRLSRVVNSLSKNINSEIGLSVSVQKGSDLFKSESRNKQSLFRSARFNILNDLNRSKERLNNLIKTKKMARKGLVRKPFASNYIAQAKRITTKTLSLSESLDILIGEQINHCKSRINEAKRMRNVVL